MQLYSILLRHYSQKDSKTGIVTYVITDNEEKIYDYINQELIWGIWNDHHNDSLSEPIEIHDDDFNVIGTEFFKERMLRLKGEYNDPDADCSDLYYGKTHYGWSNSKEISTDEENTLVNLGIAIKL